MSDLEHPNLDSPAEAMPSSAQEAAVIADDPQIAAEVASTAAERSRLYKVGGVLLAAGVVGLGLALGLGAVVIAVRVVLALVGLIGLYMGARRIGLARFGPDFDLTFVISCVWLTVLVIAAIFAPILPLAEFLDPKKTRNEPKYQPPSLFSAHPLGTDNSSLDLLGRSIYGARYSLAIAISAVVIGLLVGGAIGIIAGYFRGKVDAFIGIFTNSLLAVPALVLLIALAVVFKPPTVFTISASLSLLAIPSMIRIARANTMSFAQREFVLAARAMGATRWRVMLRELAPNVAVPMASLAMVMISVLIVAEASLSFLGLGITGAPTWGNMIQEGQETRVFVKYPFVWLVPGVFLFMTVFSFNIVGEKAQKATGGKREVKL